MTRAFFVFLFVAAAFAQTKLSTPVLGIARDAQQQLRRVDGVSGTFILRNDVAENAVDWAFDGDGGLVKTAHELLTIGPDGAIAQRHAAPQRDGVLGPRSAFFPDTSEFWERGNHVSAQPGMIAGKVIAVSDKQLAVCRANTLWLLTIDTKTAAVTHEIVPGGAIGEQACAPGRVGLLLLMPDRMLLAAAKAILVQTTAGIERSIRISATHLARAGREWIEAEIAGEGPRMIRVSRDGEQVYELPTRKERP